MPISVIPCLGRHLACSRYRICRFRFVVRHLSSEPTQTSGIEKYWQVSSHGRCCDTRSRVSWGYLKADGYSRVNLGGNLFYVHRLVAWAFLGPPPEKCAWQVHHRDGDRSNNHVQNLEYVTPSQNACHSFANPSRIRSAPLQWKPVMWRQVGSESWTICPSISTAEQQFGLSAGTVSRCCSNKSASKGFQFRFPELDEISLQGEEWRPMLDPKSGVEVPQRMVSSFGRIRSRSGIVHRGHLSKEGYYETRIMFNAVAKGALVHRLVAMAFLGHPPSDRHTQVNHKDGDKGNNAAENLEYVTPSKNVQHRFALARDKTDGIHPLCKQVWSRQFASGDKWMWHPSMVEAAGVLGVRACGVSRCCRGSVRQTGGFEFCLSNPEGTPEMLPGEEWRRVDLAALLREKSLRRSVSNAA